MSLLIRTLTRTHSLASGTIAGASSSSSDATHYEAGECPRASSVGLNGDLSLTIRTSRSLSCPRLSTFVSGVVGIATLVQAVPSLLNVSNIDGIQFSNVNSGDITTANVLRLSKVINYALCSPNSTYDGAVVTHGTDASLIK